MEHSLLEEGKDMTATTPEAVTAGRQGELWGARARDWADAETQQRPTYEEALRRAAIRPGQLVLDIGCGSGAFLRSAADRGAAVFGLDASPALLEIARSRVPDADLRVGEMQSLPYGDDSFDLVTGFNSFFFAADMVAALREAGRVAKPGANVVIQVWGAPERCDLTAMKAAMEPSAPAREQAPAPAPLWQTGVLEQLASEAGLRPIDAFDLTWAYEYPDERTMARQMLSPGMVTDAIRALGEDHVRNAIVDALAPYRTPSGGYRLENEWHYLIARA
jgi:SAM-dependent methyltransferase